MIKKHRLFWIFFCICFGTLLLLATLFDYQISLLLADLKNGQYISPNLFGRIFETIGENVIYLFIAFSSIIIALNGKKIKKSIIRYSFQFFFLCIAICFLFIGFVKIGSYIHEHNSSLIFFTHWIYKAISISISLIIVTLVCILLMKKFPQQISLLLSFSIIILITAALSQAFVQGMKPLFGRERFRAIYFFEENHLPHPGFTKWYVMNGNSSKIAALYQVDKDYFKSFPSGHTCAAGITYSLMLIPTLFPKYNRKERKWIFYVLPIFYTGIVAVSRIIMGAHYFSDVLIGGTTTFLSVWIAYFLYMKTVSIVNKKRQRI